MKISSRFFIILLIFLGCTSEKEDSFYQGFIDPPVEAKPFLRWYWSGNHIEADEIKRELDSIAQKGIGGVEIFPVGMPENAKDIGTEPVEWLSEEWNELLALTSNEVESKNMIIDLMVGGGWPFGGEYLEEDETVHRVIINEITINGPTEINENFKSLFNRMLKKNRNKSPYVYRDMQNAESNEMFFISLIPENATSEKDVIDLMKHYNDNNKEIKYNIGDGTYDLKYGVLQKGHKEIMRGVPGSSGKAFDHYSKESTIEYLNRLKKISEDTGIPLNTLLRAIFCDSIELSGGNWSKDFTAKFKQEYGYNLEPYFPFVFYLAYQGYQQKDYPEDFKDKIQRVRYDYNRLLVKIYLNNFVRTFHEFATENGLKSKYQAYGTPFHLGISEGYMIPDIPEGNNWVYTGDSPYWRSNLIWNLYAAAGGHLRGKKIISNESMTGGGMFKTSLHNLKQNDDMNFISGITHSVWNSFNYSPPEAGFPGWLWVGTWFSPQNTWWPYLDYWVEYNARLSYVFQNSMPSKSIGLIGPTGDVWGMLGLTRSHFHNTPWYLHELWKTLSQNGSSCDYLNEQIIQEATKENGKLLYGPMEYESLWLCGVKSLHLETAKAIEAYVENGGNILLIDTLPNRSLGLENANQNDAVVNSIFNKLLNTFPDNVIHINSPKEKHQLLDWTSKNLDKSGVDRQVKITNPNPGLYQIHQNYNGKMIYFFTNVWTEKTLSFKAEFPVEEKIPWVWNPETGEKKVYPHDIANKLEITLRPLESLLLVFDKGANEKPVYKPLKIDTTNYLELNNDWHLTFKHHDGQIYKRTFDVLKNFASSGDSVLQSFAGKVIYETNWTGNEQHNVLKLNNVNEGVTEVYLNEQKVGVRWYGSHIYDLEPNLKKGENKLKVIYTTVLSNYTSSLKDYNADRQFTEGHSPFIPLGIEGPVRLYAKK